ncbi:type II secretion system F family protein [Alpinimonas psychrophila]|uniref:Tight adherence protein C n=1 Tax=Alpinimonas psychrophila TaxID=748908 RepID=A0A7W3JTV3_9MICO|nr:type II secretion system F family protein [Alpinimonas psychrophila]MBA8829040.1 tight adherence protein C [Alpinimonas psychrophila]
MSTVVAFALVLGAILGLGLWIVVSTVPRLGGIPLTQRVAPFVADLSPEAFRLSTRLPGDPVSVLGKILAVSVRRFTPLSEGLLGNKHETLRRLAQAGAPLTLEGFRARQLLWALGGLAAGVVIDLATGFFGTTTPIGLAVVPVVGLVTGCLAAEFALRSAVKRRATRITSELPTVFEFTSLCLAAGESITDTLRRVAQVGSGDFAGELGHVMRQVDTGVPLASALRQLSARLQLPAVPSGIEQILGALDRGSPLAAVLQAQAQDAREDDKRELLEKAGQKEVVMLVPLVFLILPVTILFAVFPGLLVIQTGFSF